MLEIIRATSHSLRARLFAAALLLPLLALATATAGFAQRCRMTGEVVSACCCEGEAAASQAESVATWSPADCCDRVIREVASTPAEVSAQARALAERSAPVVSVAVEAPRLDLVRSVLAARSEARASLGPPSVRLRLVSKSAFLI